MNPLPFQLDPEPATETLTSYGGVPLVIQAFRSLGLPQAIERHVRIKQRERGYDEATFVESFVVLNAVGGECLEDFEQLRADAGLAELVGHVMPIARSRAQFFVCLSRRREDRRSATAAEGGREGLHSRRDRRIARIGGGQPDGDRGSGKTMCGSEDRNSR